MIDIQPSSRENGSQSSAHGATLLRDMTAYRFQQALQTPDATRQIFATPEGEKIGIIEHTLDPHKKQVYIHFFGTQNGIQSGEREYRQLGQLDLPDDKSALKRGVSIVMMERFITDACHPASIERIYLDANTVPLKEFWKQKLGRYFLEQGIFTRVSSSGYEICLTLAPKD